LARRLSCFSDRAAVIPLIGVFFRDRVMFVQALYNDFGFDLREPRC
jgi:hypothetical protein